MSCKVCNTNKCVSLHFGANVCAACAAFFRRTVAETKIFRCQRDQKCNVDQAVRNVCRACRFEKCLSVGMSVAEVQPKRDASSTRLQKRRKTITKTESEDANVLPIQVDVSAGHQSADQKIINHWQSKEIAPAPAESNNRRPGYLLDEVVELYHKMLDRRKFIVSDFMTLKSLFYNEEQQSSQPREVKHSRESHVQLKRKEMALIADFMQALRPLSQFSPDDKFTLFKQFSMQFLIVESFYQSYLNDGVRTNTITLATGEKVKLDELGHFFEKFATKILDTTTLKKLFQSMFCQGMRDLVEPMTMMKMTEREMLAFNLILLYSNKNAVGLTLDQQYALMKARNEVLDDLHDYYCDNNIMEREIRLGNLILLAPGVLEWLYKNKEHSQLIRFFGFGNPEEHLCELYD